MPTAPSFWSAFEEAPVECAPSDACKTQTRSREERDQREAGLTVPNTLTMTKTSEREERDADHSAHGLSAAHRASGTETMTMTKMVEEQDQDPIRSGLSAVPRAALVGTRTLTEQREERDQDASTDRMRPARRRSEVHV